MNRKFSIIEKSKEFNQYLNKIGEEDSKESESIMKNIRKIGGVSIIVVLCLILWASTLNEPVTVETIERIDLSQDIRNLATSSTSNSDSESE